MQNTLLWHYLSNANNYTPLNRISLGQITNLMVIIIIIGTTHKTVASCIRYEISSQYRYSLLRIISFFVLRYRRKSNTICTIAYSQCSLWGKVERIDAQQAILFCEAHRMTVEENMTLMTLF